MDLLVRACAMFLVDLVHTDLGPVALEAIVH